MKPNKYGCRVSGDVCLIHEEPLICKHGCTCSKCNCEENRRNIEEKSGNLPEADSRNAVLADVLAEIDKKDLTGGGGVLLVFLRGDLKEVLSKYFS